MHERSQELEGQVSNLKKKMSDAAERYSLTFTFGLNQGFNLENCLRIMWVFFFFSATHKTESLSNEVLILKDDFEEAKSALKQKEEEIRVYKEQLEKMGNEDFPKSPMDGDILGKV